MTRLALAVGVFVALLSPVTLSGCDCGGDGCGGVPFATPFEIGPTLEAPSTFRLGAPSNIVTRARLRVGGTGYVRLISQVERLRVLDPVVDTVLSGVGRRAVTDSARLTFEPGFTVSTTWRVAIDDLPDFIFGPLGLRASVVVDSVRLADGRLVALLDNGIPTDEACELLTGTVPDRGFCGSDIQERDETDLVPVSLRP